MENRKRHQLGRAARRANISSYHPDPLRPYNYAEESATTEKLLLRRKLSDIRSRPGQYSKQKLLPMNVSLPKLQPSHTGVDSLRLDDDYYYVRCDGQQHLITVDACSGKRVAEVALTNSNKQEYLRDKKRWLRRQLRIQHQSAQQ